jgi:MoaA/NifB/PqqE/SkfB family radical SAM enzyme
MEIMLELTRRCDMQCSHCLRGDAQGVDMTALMVRTILDKLGSNCDKIDFGGGEAILKPSLIKQFTQELHWSGISTEYLEPMWIVSNGKRLWENEEAYEEPSELAEALIKLSWHLPITLAISTDKYHPDGAERRYHHAEELFDMHPDIGVCKHGPSDYSGLVGMGRAKGNGKEVEIFFDEDDSRLLYVSLNGDIYPSCDLSYKFMDDFKDTALCFGNVMTNTYDEIMERRQKFLDLGELSDNTCLYVLEDCTGELEDLEEAFNLKEVV